MLNILLITFCCQMLCYGLKKYTEIFSLDQSSKFTFFSKYVTRAIPNLLTQSR